MTDFLGNSVSKHRPRLGFLGVGWIGRHRLQAIAQSGVAEIAAIADTSQDAALAASLIAPHASVVDGLDGLLNSNLDGMVIATPSALHAAQATSALHSGIAVFCQPPLARTSEEVAEVVEAARTQDRLLGVDLNYRGLRGARKLRRLIEEGAIGSVFAVNLMFHNACGPDKSWFYDARLSGGGCVVELGIHMMDLAMWILGFPAVDETNSCLFSRGKRLEAQESGEVEDYAIAAIRLKTNTIINLSCSWQLSTGRDAVIEASFYGTQGGLTIRNINGSFPDFQTERCHGTQCLIVDHPPDDWSGRATVEWAYELATHGKFEPEVEHLVEVSEVLDAIYGRFEKAHIPTPF